MNDIKTKRGFVIKDKSISNFIMAGEAIEKIIDEAACVELDLAKFKVHFLLEKFGGGYSKREGILADKKNTMLEMCLDGWVNYGHGENFFLTQARSRNKEIDSLESLVEYINEYELNKNVGK